MQNSINAIWENATKNSGGKIALIAGNDQLSYKTLGERIQRLAANIRAKWQIDKGTIIGLHLPNSIEFVISYFAILYSGCTVLPIDERLKPNEIFTILLDSKIQHLIAHRSLWKKFTEIEGNKKTIKHILGVEIEEPGIESFNQWSTNPIIGSNEQKANIDDIAELLYTSGTTGTPKGVLRTHKNALAAAQNAINGYGYTADDTIGISMPLSHSSALVSQMLPLVDLEGTIVLFKQFEPNPFIDAVKRYGITCMRAVPAMLRALMNISLFNSGALPNLRLIINSSEAIDAETVLALKKRFPRIELMNSYGLTEASTCTVLPDEMSTVRPDSIGRPISGVEMMLKDANGIINKEGQEGEIFIRGPHVFIGYLGRPNQTANAFKDGWLCSGDLAHKDERGYYYFHGRKDDLLITGGHKFSPLEVENCILQLSAVAEAAVIGVPFKMMAQVPKAFVVLKYGEKIDSKAIIKHCAGQLASYKVPFYVKFVESLPKNSTGKILRNRLQKIADNATN